MTLGWPTMAAYLCCREHKGEPQQRVSLTLSASPEYHATTRAVPDSAAAAAPVALGPWRTAFVTGVAGASSESPPTPARVPPVPMTPPSVLDRARARRSIKPAPAALVPMVRSPTSPRPASRLLANALTPRGEARLCTCAARDTAGCSRRGVASATPPPLPAPLLLPPPALLPLVRACPVLPGLGDAASPCPRGGCGGVAGVVAPMSTLSAAPFEPGSVPPDAAAPVPAVLRRLSRLARARARIAAVSCTVRVCLAPACLVSLLS